MKLFANFVIDVRGKGWTYTVAVSGTLLLTFNYVGYIS